ncbi:hypothetical protein CPC08DRAFT_679979 [Agrocybe pediades]|nr:hypothetical protein CPC08DRAFT_679979 [Agrocybe pediades]
MRRRADTNSSTETSRSVAKFTPAPIYSHVSTYRSARLELQLYSPSLKVHHEDRSGPIAVFSDHDQVTGKITLDSSCGPSGRLTLTVEGSFSYVPPKNLDEPNAIVEPQTHVFLTATNTISVSNWEGSSPKSVFRDAFLKRRPSVSSINLTPTTSLRCHSFSFSLPNNTRDGEELPTTYTLSKDKTSPDYFEVSYKVVVDWEPSDSTEVPSHLEVPFLLQPDTEFNCADASATVPESWLEMPLNADRPLPVRCAVTLPTSLSFSRPSSIPYFVVFSTTPRSTEMAKEVAADSSISVSLVRQISITDQATCLPTPPLTPTSEESEPSFPSLPKGPRILRRIAKSQPRLSRIRKNSGGTIPAPVAASREKPLPEIPVALPMKAFSDMRPIKNDMSIGFPKRPRQVCDKEGGHPSLEIISALPDGLWKSKMPLRSDMLPSIEWAGISVKYFLDVSVLVGHEDLRARIPIRIV